MCTKSTLLYPTDRKDFLKKEASCSLCKGERLIGNVACLCSLLQSAGGSDLSTFQRNLTSSEGTLTAVVQVRISQIERSGLRPISCFPLNLSRCRKENNPFQPLPSPCCCGDRLHASWGGNWTGINCPLKALVLLASYRRFVFRSCTGLFYSEYKWPWGESKVFSSAKSWSVYPQ